MFQFKKLIYKVVSFYKTKVLILGPDSHKVHISCKAKSYIIQMSSWDAVNAAKESMIDVHVERSQNSTIYYASFFRLKIVLCRFQITERSFLETLDFDKISHEHKEECLSQIELFDSRKLGDLNSYRGIRNNSLVEKASHRLKLRLVDQD